MSAKVHVVIGAAGVTGRRVVRNLAAAGYRVRAVTRDGRDVGVPGVERVAADASDPDAATRASEGATVVYHCAMPPIRRWRSDFPVLTDSLVTAAAATGARLVYADDTWMYGRVTAPMTAWTPVRPVSSHGVLRALLAERILSAAGSGRIRASVVRAGELYGPGVRSMIAGNVFGAVARGRPVVWFGDADQPITPTYVEDFARVLVAAGTGDTAAAGVWHVPHPPATTGRRLALEACRQAGTRLRLVELRAGAMRAAGLLVPLGREAAELVYQFEQPFVVDGRLTAERFDLEATPWSAGVAATLADAGGLAHRPSLGRGQSTARPWSPALRRSRQG